MAATTESATIDLANLTLNDEGGNEEGQASEEELDENALDGYITTDRRIHPDIVEAIYSTDRSTRLEATIKIRRLLQSQKRPPEVVVQPVIDSGLIPEIIKMLSSDDPEFLWEATWIVVNITAGSPEQTSTVVEAGVIPKLVTLFPISPDNVRINILMTVGNMLGDSKHLRRITVREGGFKLALDILRDPDNHSESCVGSAAWAVGSATTLEYGGFPDNELAAQTIPVLTTFIRQNGDALSESLIEAVVALQQLSVHHDVATAISKSGITHQIVQLCTANDHRLREKALRLIIHMSGGSDHTVQEMMDADCLSALDSCVAKHARSRGMACSAVANIARGTSSQVRALVESPLLPRMLEVLSDSAELLSSSLEAARVMLNLVQVATVNLELLDPIVEAGYLERLSQGLSSDDSYMLMIHLQAMDQILGAKWDGRQRALERFNASDGPRRLRDLRVRKSTRKSEPAKVARKIVETHFPELSKWPRV